ncbi:MAG: hypothetical protein KKF30_03210 [Proteobacteria bacterium]|nr:hypothetical protein [Pseudomonadota bacterium]MBU4471354.1 hypothetical protein [Pseudomonadota bacterium]MCG2751643.1 hypothetical protein [Desulfobacteraceae bacterium]
MTYPDSAELKNGQSSTSEIVSRAMYRDKPSRLSSSQEVFAHPIGSQDGGSSNIRGSNSKSGCESVKGK